MKMDLALNNQQWLICHKTKPKLTKNIFIFAGELNSSTLVKDSAEIQGLLKTLRRINQNTTTDLLTKIAPVSFYTFYFCCN